MTSPPRTATTEETAEKQPVQTVLRPIARQSWTSWQRQAPEAHTWLWFDLDGIQLTTDLPRQAPIATHLWGWRSGESWVRLRLDDARVVGSQLLTDTSGVVAARCTQACQWPEGSGRVDPRPELALESLRKKSIALVQTPHPTALTFVELTL